MRAIVWLSLVGTLLSCSHSVHEKDTNANTEEMRQCDERTTRALDESGVAREKQIIQILESGITSISGWPLECTTFVSSELNSWVAKCQDQDSEDVFSMHGTFNGPKGKMTSIATVDYTITKDLSSVKKLKASVKDRISFCEWSHGIHFIGMENNPPNLPVWHYEFLKKEAPKETVRIDYPKDRTTKEI